MNQSAAFMERLKELAGEEVANQLLGEFAGDLLSIPRYVKDVARPASGSRDLVIYEATLSQAVQPSGFSVLLQALAAAHKQGRFSPAVARLTLVPLPMASSDQPVAQTAEQQPDAQDPECFCVIDSPVQQDSHCKSVDCQGLAPSLSAHDLDNPLDKPPVNDGDNSKEQMIHIPKSLDKSLSKRNLQIVGDFDGSNHQELALMYNLSLRAIHRIIQDSDGDCHE